MKGDWLEGAVEAKVEKRRTGKSESSVVVPINKAFEASQKVLPSRQVFHIFLTSRIIAKTDCECREAMGKCDAPRDVCILLGPTADNQIRAGKAKEISIAEAERLVEKAEKAGLIHLIINHKDWKPEAICSCCPCCCQELNAMLKFKYLDAVLQSDYVAEKDKAKCTDCGACVERCHFKAHASKKGKVAFTQKRCFGCGLCVATCPTKALTLVKRPGKK